LRHPQSEEEEDLASILVHITNGPEHPTRSALGLLVARTAVEEGHDVSVFLAGDAVALIREPVRENLNGLGTGNAKEHFDALMSGGARLYLSGMSSKARGISPEMLEGMNAEMAMPTVLVKLALEHDKMFTY
jgi:predicted peroxiredoxin